MIPHRPRRASGVPLRSDSALSLAQENTLLRHRNRVLTEELEFANKWIVRLEDEVDDLRMKLGLAEGHYEHR